MTEAELAIWNHPKYKHAAILVNPAKRRSLLKGVAVAATIGAALLVLLSDNGPLARWAQAQDQQSDRAQLAPTMERLATQGKRDGIIWVARNLPEKDSGKLAALAATGDGEALYLQAQELWKTDQTESKRLLALSADAGYVPAVKFNLNVGRHRVLTLE